MLDGHGRSIDYLRLSLTTMCDLRCRYCQPEGVVPGALELSLDDFLFLVRCAAKLGVSVVRLTGGEPLLRAGLDAFIEELSAIPGIKDVALTTNGTLLSQLALPLKNKGLKRVNISIDSLRQERYTYITRGGDLGKVLAGIDAALLAGLFPVKLNCVVMRGFNEDEVPAFAELTRNKDLSVRFIEVMPFGEGVELPSTAVVPSQEIMASIGQLETAFQEGSGPAKVFRLPGARGTIGFISGVSEYFCGGCNRLRVTSYGTVRPCLFVESEYDIYEHVVNRDGKALEQALLTVVANKPRREQYIDRRRMAEIGG